MTLSREIQLRITGVAAAVALFTGVVAMVVASATDSTLLAVLLVAAIVVIPVVVTYFAASRLAMQTGAAIEALIEGVEAVAGGDFSRRVEETGDAEMRRLAEHFNSLVETLEMSLNEIEAAGQAVAASAQQILTAAEEQQRAATQQSASLHETASTVEELDLSAQQASDNAQEVVARTERASQEILALSEKAQGVSRASEVIDEVSRQIRILALNASIEAARSDSNGGGFSVIASEIRRLADDTRKSTGEIDALVQDMEEATSSSVMIMEQTVESVKVIGLAMSQQSVATGQITEAMAEMNAGMRQTVESTTSTVDAGEDLNNLAYSLQQTIAELRGMELTYAPVDEETGYAAIAEHEPAGFMSRAE